MRDHHLYIIFALLLLVLYCMMYHTRRYPEGFGDCATCRALFGAARCPLANARHISTPNTDPKKIEQTFHREKGTMPHYTTFRSAVMRCETCDHDFYVDLIVQPFRCVLCNNIVAAPHLPSYQRMELFDAVKLLPEGDEEQDQKEIENALYDLSWYDGSRNQVTACWYEILHSDAKETQVYDLLRYLENALLRHTLNM